MARYELFKDYTNFSRMLFRERGGDGPRDQTRAGRATEPHPPENPAKPRGPRAIVKKTRAPSPSKESSSSCSFCKRNGETTDFYRLHTLRDSEGLVTCPILRKYVCPNCGASGDSAHTVKYCPLPDRRVTSAVATLRTPRMSNGKMRVS